VFLNTPPLQNITNLTWDMGSLIMAKRFQLSRCRALAVLFLNNDNILIGVTVVIPSALIAEGDTLHAHRFYTSRQPNINSS
jgi:hypothetical protein